MGSDENDEGELLSSDFPTGPAGGSRATGSQVRWRHLSRRDEACDPDQIPFPRNHSHRERAWRPLATIYSLHHPAIFLFGKYIMA
jgi:hypothetical protein